MLKESSIRSVFKNHHPCKRLHFFTITKQVYKVLVVNSRQTCYLGKYTHKKKRKDEISIIFFTEINFTQVYIEKGKNVDLPKGGLSSIIPFFLKKGFTKFLCNFDIYHVKLGI